jgi:hypothetical protein
VIDREALLKSRLAEAVHQIPGVGEVRIRSLSGKETAQLPGFKDDVAGGEEFVLVRAVVDPVLTPPDVAAWRESAPYDEIAGVLTAIFELSGLGETALKDAVKSFRGPTGETPGVPPGPNPRDDGG